MSYIILMIGTYPTATRDLGTLHPPTVILRQQALTTPPVGTQNSAHLDDALLCAKLLILSILEGGREEGGREGGREWREGVREEGRDRGREGRTEGGREG